MSKSNLKLIETSKLFSSSECEEIVRKTLCRNDVAIKKVEVFGDATVFGFLGEYFRLVIHIADGTVVSIVQNCKCSPNSIHFTLHIRRIQRNHWFISLSRFR